MPHYIVADIIQQFKQLPSISALGQAGRTVTKLLQVLAQPAARPEALKGHADRATYTRHERRPGTGN